ncbi:MAG: SPFH domain-containing protein [Planctomycetes bacterium]|nr:SPFH domain-containing protein [Planctomycetota bacterium]
MGILDFIKNQAIDVISWLDDSTDTLCYRFQTNGQEIKRGAQLTVREGQAAIFVHEGQMGDVFKPGLFTLTTQNIPILTKLSSWKYGFESPFKAEVYFVSTKPYIDMKWGTATPVALRDADFGIVRVRAHGIYTIQIVDPALFFKSYVGTDGYFTIEKIQGQLRTTLVSSFTTTLGQAKIPVLDLAAKYEEIGATLQQRMDPEFRKTGVSLVKLVIESVTMPEEVEKAIDARSSMGAVGNLGAYTQYQAAQAMREAAHNPGMGGAFVGMGAGMGMGQIMSQSMAASGMGAPPPAPATAEAQYHLAGPMGQQGPMPLAAAVGTIRANPGAAINVWAAGMASWQPWQQVPALAAQMGPPPAPGAMPPPPPMPAAPPPPPPSAPAAPPESKFHYSSGGAAEGPFAASEVARRVRANPSGSHKVWKEGMPGWVDAASVDEIAARLS